MTLDELLERGLGAAAQDYAVPPSGAHRLREQLVPDHQVDDVRRRPRVREWLGDHRVLAAAASVVLILIAVPIAVGGSGGGGEGAGGESAASNTGGGGGGGLVVKATGYGH